MRSPPVTTDTPPRAALSEDILPTALRWWAVPLGLSVAAGAALYPFDDAVFSAVRGVGERLGGDVRRELGFIGQFGALTSVVITALVIWRLDRARAPVAWRVLLAAGFSALACLALKMLIGRPRPKFDDPGVILGPFGAYPIDPETGVRHAWEVGSGISSDLWSMPSSHTAGAFALAAVLARWYPRIGALMLALAATVGLSRVLFGAHYPSDIAVGAGIGWISGGLALRIGRTRGDLAGCPMPAPAAAPTAPLAAAPANRDAAPRPD